MMPDNEFQRKLSAIFSADVKGYSRLMGDDDELTVTTITAYRQIIADLILNHRGRVVDTPGDNILAEFSSALDAVNSAIDIQLKLEVENGKLPRNRRMDFRIGINLGDILHKDDRIYGDGVNVAARIESLAEPGGICISRGVYDQVQKRVSQGFEYLGEHAVKNIDEPVRIYRVLLSPGAAGRIVSRPKATSTKRIIPSIVGMFIAVVVCAAIVWTFYLRPPAPDPTSNENNAAPLPDKPSIVVLPFDNLSDDSSQQYFCDGMTEDLITDLSKISGMLVIARHSSFAYKGKTIKIKQVAEELGVRYVLEGSVRKSGNQVRISAKLIDAQTGHPRWADRYDGDLKDVFGLQDKVTRNIVTVLAVQLNASDEARFARRGTDNELAYDNFLKGWEHYLRQTPDDFRKAILYFKTSVELDPQYTRPQAALAATYWETWKRFWHERIGLGRIIHEPRFLAEKFLVEAMRNPTPLAHQVASERFLHKQQHEKAISEAQSAIALDPNDADSYVALAGALSLAGRADEALGWIERAMRSNPHYPSYYLYQLGLARFSLEQLDKAALVLEQAVALNPDDRWSYRLLLSTYGLLGRRQEAEEALEAIEERDQRGWLNFFDPITIRSSTFWLPFKENRDAVRFTQGLRNAGIPD